MKIVDANIVLRYLLNDFEEFTQKATEIIENNDVFIPNEVIAEVVYVLEKVYEVSNIEISTTLKELFRYDNFSLSDTEVVEVALALYGSRRLDFVDTLLYAYGKAKGYEVFTFDKKLKNLLNELNK